MVAIVDIVAREVLDSRGHPTVEAHVVLEGGIRGRAIAPAGASVGIHEAAEQRDGGPRYAGRGVRGAIAAIHDEIAPALRGLDASAQARLDAHMAALDGTPNKARMGANAIVAVSLALARASARAAGLPLFGYLGGAGARTLPIPFMNILNGGAHADNALDFQEFMIAPVGAPSFPEALRWGAEVYHVLGAILRVKGLGAGLGDEGGFAPDIADTHAALGLVVEAIGQAGFTPGDDIAIGLDAAASAFLREGRYHLPGEGKSLTPDALVRFYEALAAAWPLVSIEDGMGEDDHEGWRALTQALGERLMLVGDDLFATSAERVRAGIARRCANGVLIKVNQAGSLSDALDAARVAQEAGMAIMVSHRSGESEDTFIADLAVALNGGSIKAGAPARSERTAKYNRLLRIDAMLGEAARYAGAALRGARGP